MSKGIAKTPTAIAARFDRRIGRLVIDLSSGLSVSFKPHDAQGLESAKPDQLQVIEISPSGLGLHFPALDQHEQVSAIRDGRYKTEVPVERCGRIVFCMDGKRAYSDNIGNLKCAPQGIQEQTGTNAAALPFAVHGETRQNEKRYRMTWHAFDNTLRRINVPDFTGDNRIVPDNLFIACADVGLR